MAHVGDVEWEDMLIDENYSEEGGDVDSSNDSQCTDDQNSSISDDDLNDSEFEVDDMVLDENIEDEIELIGEKIKSNQPVSANVGIHLRDRGSQSKTQKGKCEVQVYQGDAEDSDFEFEIGLCFNTASDFRDAVRLHATKQGKPLKFIKNCSDKIRVTCDCGWTMYSSFMSRNEKTFQVKTITWEHTCCRVANSQHCNSKYLAKKYEHNIRSNPEWPASSMQEIMQRDNKTSLSIWKMYRVKKHASKLISGTELEQYAKLWDYIEEIYRTNPDTTIKVKCKHVVASQTCVFKRLYVCWGALKKGFMAGCRPIIGLDGTHLKTSTGGVLLCVVGVDGEICHSIQQILENNKKNAHNYILVWNGHHKFEVEGWRGDKWTVDLGSRSCSCRRWDLTGIPCVHATSCIFYRRENVEDFVEHWYRKDMFMKAYEHLLNPLKSHKEWSLANLNPIVSWCNVNKKTGRPSHYARRKEDDEIEGQKYGVNRHGMKYTCSNCGMRGHNKKSCVEASNTNDTTSTTKRKLPVRRNM